MTEDEPQTVPDADPAAVSAIAAELAARQAQREAHDLEVRAARRAAILARMADMRAKAATGFAIYNEGRAALRAEREKERQEARAAKRAEMAELKEKLAAIPKPDRSRAPGIPIYLPKRWARQHLYAAVRAMLALCSEDKAAYDIARAVQDAIIEAYPDARPTKSATDGPTPANLARHRWSTPIVIGPQPDPDD